MVHNVNAEESSVDPQFRVIEILTDPDGVVVVMTERVRDGRVSFMIAREFDDKGKTKRSAYLARRHIAAARRLLSDLEERLELLEDRARARKRDRKGDDA